MFLLFLLLPSMCDFYFHSASEKFTRSNVIATIWSQSHACTHTHIHLQNYARTKKTTPWHRRQNNNRKRREEKKTKTCERKRMKNKKQTSKETNNVKLKLSKYMLDKLAYTCELWINYNTDDALFFREKKRREKNRRSATTKAYFNAINQYWC